MDDSKPVTRKKAEHSVRYLEDDFVFFPLNLIGLCRNRKWFEFLFFFFFFLFFSMSFFVNSVLFLLGLFFLATEFLSASWLLLGFDCAFLQNFASSFQMITG